MFATVKAIAKEIKICSSLSHPNIVTFLGFMIERGYPLLISEWIENGTLEEFLEANIRAQIGHIVRWLITIKALDSSNAQALGIAKGLKYLHDLDVIHSDLKGVRNSRHQALTAKLTVEFAEQRTHDSLWAAENH